MEDLGAKLHPITKLEIYQACRKFVFEQMQKNRLTPKRADEILGYVKDNANTIKNPELAKSFYTHLQKKFSELETIKHNFDMKEKESIDKALALLLDEFMIIGNFDLANEIMEQIKESQSDIEIIEKLKNKYPLEFQRAIGRFSENWHC